MITSEHATLQEPTQRRHVSNVTDRQTGGSSERQRTLQVVVAVAMSSTDAALARHCCCHSHALSTSQTIQLSTSAGSQRVILQ